MNIEKLQQAYDIGAEYYDDVWELFYKVSGNKAMVADTTELNWIKSVCDIEDIISGDLIKIDFSPLNGD